MRRGSRLDLLVNDPESPLWGAHQSVTESVVCQQCYLKEEEEEEEEAK